MHDTMQGSTSNNANYSFIKQQLTNMTNDHSTTQQVLHDSTNTARLKPQLNAADYHYNIA